MKKPSELGTNKKGKGDYHLFGMDGRQDEQICPDFLLADIIPLNPRFVKEEAIFSRFFHQKQHRDCVVFVHQESSAYIGPLYHVHSTTRNCPR
jgi:hypothetical protein